MRNKLRFFTPMLSSSLNSGLRYYSSARKTTPFSTQHSKRAGETEPDDNKITIYPPPITQVKEVSPEEQLAGDLKMALKILNDPKSGPVDAKPVLKGIVDKLEAQQKSWEGLHTELYSKALMLYARAANASSSEGRLIAIDCYEKVVKLNTPEVSEAQNSLDEMTCGLLGKVPPGVEIIFDDTPDESIDNGDEEGLYDYGTIDEDGEFKSFTP